MDFAAAVAVGNGLEAVGKIGGGDALTVLPDRSAGVVEALVGAVRLQQVRFDIIREFKFEDMLGTYDKLGNEYWYLEYAGLTVTPEIFWKSAAVFVLAILSCIPVAAVVDRIAVRTFRSRLLGQNRKAEKQKAEKQKDDGT